MIHYNFFFVCLFSLYHISAFATHDFLRSASISTQWNGKEYSQNSLLQEHWADKFFFQHYEFTGNEHVLDIGSGDGKLTARIAEKVSKGYVIGLDKSDSMVSFAVRNFQKMKNLQFILLDAQDRDFYENHPQTFDLVVSFTVLHWVKDQDTVLQGIRRVLKPGGKFYIRLASYGGDPIQDIADQLIMTEKYQVFFRNFIDPMNRYSIEDYQTILRAANLHLLQIVDTEERDKIQGKALLIKQLKSWLPHYHFLEEDDICLAERFMEDVVNRYLREYPPDSYGTITLYDHYLEIVGESRD
jgi:trans-aconitate 2-methyltransferase